MGWQSSRCSEAWKSPRKDIRNSSTTRHGNKQRAGQRVGEAFQSLKESAGTIHARHSDGSGRCMDGE